MKEVKIPIRETLHCCNDHGKYSGLAPAITALIAIFSIVATRF